jgi:ABC-type glycerol-3-phosphate transport system substrate-binding protein
MPDVSMLGNNVVAQYQALGALTPLTPYFDAWSEEVGSDITEDFWPGDRGYYYLDGDWWGSPMNVETRALWYRQDLLAEAGFEEPPLTWEELQAVAVALTTDDVYGFGIPGAIDYPTLQVFMNVYLSYGARFLNDEGMCGLDSPEYEQALAYYTDLYLEHEVTPPDTPTYSRSQLVQLLSDGRLAMYIDGPWILGTVQDADPAWINDLSVAPIPAGPEGRFGFLGGWPLVLWAESDHPDEAWEWIRYATNPEGGLPGIAAAANLPPGRQSIADQWLESYDEPWNERFGVFLEGLEYAFPYQHPDPEIPQMATIEVDVLQTGIQNVMLETESVEEAAASTCERMNAILSR